MAKQNPQSIAHNSLAAPMQSGKRQRRQAAALVVQSLWSNNNSSNNNNATNNSKSNNNSKKKSSSGSRPKMEVPPMGFGPIREPNANDVLCGRGGLINGSPGNVQFRDVVAKRKKEYNAKTTKRNEKAHMAAEIVRQIRSMSPPGRFLREDANGVWWDVGDARAIRKTGQALREAAPAIRQDGDGSEAGNEDDKAASDSGSDKGTKDVKEQPAAEESAGSPKKNKNETPPPKKDAKPKKDTATADTKPVEAPTATKKTTKRNWLMGGKNRATTNNNDTSDAVSVSAETVRSSQTYMIPQAALGSHINNPNTPVVAAMPRMSPGAVFSNTHHHNPNHRQQPHPPYPQHPHYPYPYPHHHMHPHQHMPPPPPGPHHAYPAHHPGVPMMMSPKGTISEDAFGMNFFPTRDVNMEQRSESACTLSDISGLSSSMTPGDQRKRVTKKSPQQHHYHYQHPHQQHQSPTEVQMEGVPPLPTPPLTTSISQNMEEVSMLDTTSSLPSFSDILDDVDMASATSGGVSVSTASIARMIMAPPPPQPKVNKPKRIHNNNNSKMTIGDAQMKENSNSTGSCLSGTTNRSEVSLPSSCGTAMSQFSDSFMALHLSGQNEFE